MTVQPYATSVGALDLVAIERVMNGTLSHAELSKAEKVYAARHWDGSAKSVGRALGVTEKTVTRWREGDA